MTITLSPEDARFIDEQVKAGRYRSADMVVGVALERLRSETVGDFEPGELAALVAEGEADIQAGRVVDGEEAFRIIRENLRTRRGPHTADE